MTDITSLFNDILLKHGEHKPDKRPAEYKSDTVDDFLQEAYKIVRKAWNCDRTKQDML